jgi:hypothetical protein
VIAFQSKFFHQPLAFPMVLPLTALVIHENA